MQKKKILYISAILFDCVALIFSTLLALDCFNSFRNNLDSKNFDMGLFLGFIGSIVLILILLAVAFYFILKIMLLKENKNGKNS